MIALILFTTWLAFDAGGPQLGYFYRPLPLGTFVGLILGDVKTGLAIGATLQMMSLGVIGMGGASVPDYVSATLIATVVGIQSGQGLEIGLALGLPVGMLYINLDVLQKLINGRISALTQRLFNEKKFGAAMKSFELSRIVMWLKYMVPLMLVIVAGESVVDLVLNVMPDWLMNGLTVAGKVLPVTGMAILLNFMPLKKNILYFIIGFVLFAYLNVPVLGVALVGVGLAVKYYQDHTQGNGTANVGGLEDE